MLKKKHKIDFGNVIFGNFPEQIEESIGDYECVMDREIMLLNYEDIFL